MSLSLPITGRCLCGATRYRITAPLLWCAFCHCDSCRRATGAPMASYLGADVTADIRPGIGHELHPQLIDKALEQLRMLWHGYDIVVECVAEAPPAGVDTPEDLARVRAYFAANLSG